MTEAPFDFNELTEEQKYHSVNFLAEFSKLDKEILVAIPPAKMKLLKKAFSMISSTTKYGSIELVVSDNVVQNVNVRQSLK
jgi:hypothetical protein